MATLTNFLKLYKPAANEIGWDDNMNANLDVVDNFINQFMHIPNFVGAWTNTTAYAVGQIALDIATGVLYRANVAHTSAGAPTTFAQDRTAHPTFWTQTTSPAQDSATAAANSASAAATSATSAQNSLNTFRSQYYGAFASDPLTDPLGGARTAGDLYFNTTTARMRVFHTTPAPAAWADIAVGFDDAPTTPVGAAFLRTAAHTWVNGVPQSGGNFTGDVSGTNFLVGIARPAGSINTGMTLTAHMYADDVWTQNLYIALTPTPAAWRYISTANAGAHSALLVNATWATTGPLANQRIVTMYTTPTTEAIVAGAVATLQAISQWRSDGTFQIFGQGFKPGGGVWADSSDARIKNIVGPYPHGLAQLLEMLPQLFTYKGNDYSIGTDGEPDVQLHPDTTTQHVGLIAQDCEPYMPELVTTTSAFIDGVLVNDVRQLDATGVIYALVNAVAELNARIRPTGLNTLGYTFDTTSVLSDVAAGQVRVNDTDMTVVSHIYISITDSNGIVVTPVLNCATTGNMLIQSVADPTKITRYAIFAGGLYGDKFDFTVAYQPDSTGLVPAGPVTITLMT